MKQYPGEIRQVNGWYAISAEQVATRGVFDPVVDNPNANYRGITGWLAKAVKTGSLTPNRSSNSADAVQVDFAGKDPYAIEVRAALARAEKAVAATPKLQELLQKRFWSRGDRVTYEAMLSQIASEEMGASPLLEKYRSLPLEQENGKPENLNAVKLNTNFNCRGMAITEAFLLQSLEDKFLPKSSGRDGVWKERGSYYLAAGVQADTGSAGGHLFILYLSSRPAAIL
jgi:hypothetical protein